MWIFQGAKPPIFSISIEYSFHFSTTFNNARILKASNNKSPIRQLVPLTHGLHHSKEKGTHFPIHLQITMFYISKLVITTAGVANEL
jgi:hypothetical protein